MVKGGVRKKREGALDVSMRGKVYESAQLMLAVYAAEADSCEMDQVCAREKGGKEQEASHGIPALRSQSTRVTRNQHF